MPDELEQSDLVSEGATGFEEEDTSGDPKIVEPFDPSLIRVESKPMTVSLLLTRIRQGEINLHRDFKERPGFGHRRPRVASSSRC